MRRMKKFPFMIATMVGLTLCQIRPAFAEDKPFEKTATGKAAKALISSFTNFVKDVTEMNGMTDQQKLDYILKKGKERIWKETADRVKDTAKDKILEYVKARMRADLFKAAVPSMMNQAIVEGKAVSAVWSAADVDIKSKLDTQMNAVKAGISAAKVGWSVYSTWSTKGAEEGCRELGKQTGEKIIEYFIPGWGWYRLAQAATEALGNYVVAYAFDTSLQAKMDVVLSGHDPKSNPKAFKDWILATDIQSYVQKEWDEQLAYGGWYLKGKNNEGDSMEKAIIASLNQMKAEVQKRAAIENEVRSNLEGLDSEAKAAAAAVQGVIDGAGKDAQPALGMIDNFNSNIYEYQKEDYQETVEQTKAQDAFVDNLWARCSPVHKYDEVKFSHDTILSALRDAFADFKEAGASGYDQKTVEAGIKRYQEVRAATLKGTTDKIAALVKEGEQVNAQAAAIYYPQQEAIWARIVAAYNGPVSTLNALYAQAGQINEAWSAMTRPYMNIDWVFGEAFGLDVDVLTKEEQSVMFEIKNRVAGMRVYLDNQAEEYQNEIDKMVATYQDNMAAATDAAGNIIDYSELLQQLTDHKDDFFSFYAPGDAIKQMDHWKQIKADLIANKEIQPKVIALQKKAFDEYMLAAQNLVNHFENSIPKSLQDVQRGSGPGVEYTLSNHDILSDEIWRAYNLGGRADRIDLLGQRTIANIPRVWDYYRSADEYSKTLDSTQAVADTEKNITFIDGLITEMEFYDSVDRIALGLSRLMSAVQQDPIVAETIQRTMDNERSRLGELMSDQGRPGFMSTEPEKTKGYEFMNQLKASWAQASPLVDRMETLFKGLKQVKYFSGFNDQAKKTIEQLRTIPARIALYEERYAYNKKTFDGYIERGFKSLEEAKKKLEDLKTNSWYQEKKDNIEKFHTSPVRSNLQYYGTWAVTEQTKKLVEDWTAFDKEVDKAIEQAKKDIEAEDQRVAQLRVEADAKAKQAEAARLAQAEQERLQNEHHFTPGLYQVTNPRINTRTIPVSFGDLILMPDDLNQGTIEITARLSSIDKIDRILFSEDSGRTWVELPVNANIHTTITPIPDKVYNPVIKIRSTLADEIIIPIFSSLNIVYRNLDVQQMVAESVKQIAEAYEREDLALFSKYISMNYLGNKSFLEEGVRLDFDLFTSMKLTIYINRIQKQNNTYIAETKWDKDQTPRKTGQQQKTTGNTTMIFVLEDGLMKIQNLRGNLIYATLSPEIAQASGLNSRIVDQIRTAANDRNPTQPGAGTIEDAGGVVAHNSITLTSPTGGQTWTVGGSNNITWTTSGTVSNVKIEYSTDGGFTYPNVITTSASASSGSYSWTVPNDPSTTARVRITDASDATVYDASGSNFTIAASGGGTITVVAPASGASVSRGSSYDITWSATGGVNYGKIEFSDNGGASYQVLNAVTPGPGLGWKWTWTTPATNSTVGANKIIRITKTTMAGAVDPSVSGSVTFNIIP